MKIMRQLLPLVMMFFAFSCVAKENTLVTKQLSVGSFDAVKAECVDLQVTVGAATGTLSVTATPEVLEHFSARVSGNILKITCLRNGSDNFLKKFFKNNKKPVVKITVPALREIDAQLSATVVVDNVLTVSDIEVSCETSSLVKLAGITATGAVELKSETSSTISVDDLSARTLEADCETSATIAIGTLKASVADLQTETASVLKINAIDVDKLEADAETASTIRALAGTVKYGEFSAETASQVNFESVSIAGGSSESNTAGKVKAKYCTR